MNENIDGGSDEFPRVLSWAFIGFRCLTLWKRLQIGSRVPVEAVESPLKLFEVIKPANLRHFGRLCAFSGFFRFCCWLFGSHGSFGTVELWKNGTVEDWSC